MSFSWTTPGHGLDHDEPRDVHTSACALWLSDDPVDDCDCDTFNAGVEGLVNLFESYAPQQTDDHADGAA